jgi:hypothetical protein
VEYQGRAEIQSYLLSGVARTTSDAFKSYDIKNKLGDEKKHWEDVLIRSTLIEDDGHSSKLIRTLALGRMVSKPYEERAEFKIGGEDWLRIANMVEI